MKIIYYYCYKSYYIVAFKPTFKKRPIEAETYAAVQGNVTIKCNPEAAPKPTFVWKKDQNVLGKEDLFYNIFKIINIFICRFRRP